MAPAHQGSLRAQRHAQPARPGARRAILSHRPPQPHAPPPPPGPAGAQGDVRARLGASALLRGRRRLRGRGREREGGRAGGADWPGQPGGGREGGRRRTCARGGGCGGAPVEPPPPPANACWAGPARSHLGGLTGALAEAARQSVGGGSPSHQNEPSGGRASGTGRFRVVGRAGPGASGSRGGRAGGAAMATVPGVAERYFTRWYKAGERGWREGRKAGPGRAPKRRAGGRGGLASSAPPG